MNVSGLSLCNTRDSGLSFTSDNITCTPGPVLLDEYY